jgi:tRNA-splicing ligase RtcB (3'-phosphate/5'-hydroxy nucleic acid ligase)
MDYIMDMNFALEFALLNRKIMLEKTLKILGAETTLFINKNHNCADIMPDGHILHRKGATSSNLDELGIIP